MFRQLAVGCDKKDQEQSKFRERWGKGVVRQAVVDGVDGELQLAGR